MRSFVWWSLFVDWLKNGHVFRCVRSTIKRGKKRYDIFGARREAWKQQNGSAFELNTVWMGRRRWHRWWCDRIFITFLMCVFAFTMHSMRTHTVTKTTATCTSINQWALIKLTHAYKHFTLRAYGRYNSFDSSMPGISHFSTFHLLSIHFVVWRPSLTL